MSGWKVLSLEKSFKTSFLKSFKNNTFCRHCYRIHDIFQKKMRLASEIPDEIKAIIVHRSKVKKTWQ